MLTRNSGSAFGKDVFSKQLIAHMQKCINPQEVPPKAKHVRAIILETHTQKTTSFLYGVVRALQVLNNQIVCWKYLIVIHKVMRSGFNEAIRYSPKKISIIEEIKRTWSHYPGQYAPVIKSLCSVIITKFRFHRNFPNIPGDFEITQNEIMSTIGRSTDSLMAYEICVLDYLEELLDFQPMVFSMIDRSGINSAMSNNCRLASLTQCIQDCASLYDLALKALIKLHTLLPPESLSSLRERFNRIYLKLKRFFEHANSFRYIKDLLRIPALPNTPPNFLGSVSGIESIEVIENPDDEVTDKLVGLDVAESAENEYWKTGDVDSILALTAAPQSTSPVSTPSQDAYFEIEMLKSEIQRIQNEKSGSQDQLLSRIRTLENELQTLLQVKSRQDEQLTQLVSEVRSQTANSALSEEKFIKVRDAYTKLREEHVDLLKKMQNMEMGSDSKQRLAALELEKLASQETQRKLETQLAEARAAMQAASGKTADLASQLENARSAFEQEISDLLLKAACLKAKQDSKNIEALMEDPEFVQCRSCVEIVSSFVKSATGEVLRLKDIVSDPNGRDASKLPLTVAHLSSYLIATVLHAKTIANSAADIVKSDELTALCKRCLSDGEGVYTNLVEASSLKDESRRSAVRGHADALVGALASVQTLTEAMRPHIQDVNAKDLASVLEQEMQRTTELIARAQERFRQLLEQSKTTMTGVQLEVHSKILDTCNKLMSAIALLVQRARELQSEIVNEGRGTASVTEFYKRHNRWTEGLFSAAKSVGAGANFLVETADAIVKGNGQFERMAVAALEISSSTTQLLVASRVKARVDSCCLGNLETAAKDVSRVTGEVVAGAQNASAISEQSVNMDFARLSYTQAHKTEVDSQVRVLELESQLEAERKKLAEIRRFNYTNSAEFEQKT